MLVWHWVGAGGGAGVRRGALLVLTIEVRAASSCQKQEASDSVRVPDWKIPAQKRFLRHNQLQAPPSGIWILEIHPLPLRYFSFPSLKLGR